MSAIYILRAVGVGKIKIGISDDVTRRMSEIQAMCPVQLELVATLDDADFSLESVMHSLAREHWSHGEWFGEAALPKVLRHFDIVRSATNECAQMLADYIPASHWQELMENLTLGSDAMGIVRQFANITGNSVMDRRAR